MSVGRFGKTPEEAAGLALALTRLVEASNYGAEAVDRPSFRVDNEALMPLLDVLEQTPYLKHDTDFYHIRLAAIVEIENEKTRSIRGDCNRILALLVEHYRNKETRRKQKHLSEIATELELPPRRVEFCVDVLLEEAWAWAGGNSNRTEPFEKRWIQPGENILRHKTVEAMLPTLDRHIESTATQRFGIRRPAKKKLPQKQSAISPQPVKAAAFRTPFDSYVPHRIVGEGGSSTVYEVRNAAGEIFAAKVLKAEIVNTTRMKRFRNEAAFCHRVDHPHILKVIDWGLRDTSSDGPLPFIVLPMYPVTLRDQIRKGLPKGEVLPTFAKILDGVEAAHLLGVLHRDIKPENVLVNPSTSQIVVADFGIAHFAEEQLHTAVETKTTERLANFKYAAPEQKSREATVGVPADIYALGLILNEMFTSEVIHGTGYRTIAAGAPEYGYLDELVEAMIRQQADHRPQSIRDVKDYLISRGVSYLSQQRVDALRRSVVNIDNFDSQFTHEVSARPATEIQVLGDTADEKELERGFTKSTFRRTGARPDALLRLAQLRSEGVEMRNAASHMLFTTHLDEWGAKIGSWIEDVIEAVRVMNPADAEWFATLDAVPQPRVPIPNLRLGGQADRELFASVFRQHDYRLARLEKLLQKYGVG